MIKTTLQAPQTDHLLKHVIFLMQLSVENTSLLVIRGNQ